ncbi:hypothetical protein HK102_001675 [Quaeritorhiza haematococci]|nr:hypothetical protein HK102_001675 [Quaeritorhiza haematococci]
MLGLYGERVDAIRHHWQRFLRFDARLKNKQAHFLGHQWELPAAFVIFNDQLSVFNAANATVYDRPFRISDLHPCVDPKDLNWDAVNMDIPLRSVMKTVRYVLTTLTVLLWGIIAAAVSSITQIEQLVLTFPWLKPVVEFHPFLRKYRLQRLFFFFLLFNVLLVISISGSVFSSLETILRNPTSIPDRLAVSIPDVSQFYVNYVMLLALTGPGTELLQALNLFVRPILPWFFGTTPRAKHYMQQPWFFYAGPQYGQHALVATIGIVYSTIAPFVLLFVALYFFLYSIVMSYNMQMVYSHMSNMGGLFLYPSAMQLFAGLYIHQITIAGLFYLNDAWWQGHSILILLAATIIANFVVRKGYRGLIHSLPVQTLINAGVQPLRPSNVSNHDRRRPRPGRPKADVDAARRLSRSERVGHSIDLLHMSDSTTNSSGMLRPPSVQYAQSLSNVEEENHVDSLARLENRPPGPSYEGPPADAYIKPLLHPALRDYLEQPLIPATPPSRSVDGAATPESMAPTVFVSRTASVWIPDDTLAFDDEAPQDGQDAEFAKSDHQFSEVDLQSVIEMVALESKVDIGGVERAEDGDSPTDLARGPPPDKGVPCLPEITVERALGDTQASHGVGTPLLPDGKELELKLDDGQADGKLMAVGTPPNTTSVEQGHQFNDPQNVTPCEGVANTIKLDIIVEDGFFNDHQPHGVTDTVTLPTTAIFGNDLLNQTSITIQTANLVDSPDPGGPSNRDPKSDADISSVKQPQPHSPHDPLQTNEIDALEIITTPTNSNPSHNADQLTPSTDPGMNGTDVTALDNNDNNKLKDKGKDPVGARKRLSPTGVGGRRVTGISRKLAEELAPAYVVTNGAIINRWGKIIVSHEALAAPAPP